MDILNWITDLDVMINYWIQQNLRNDILTSVFQFITSLSDYGWFWILIIIVLLINKKTRKAGLIALVSFVLCALVVNVFMKPLFMRIRPYDLVDHLIYIGEKPWDYSFPSGHTSAAFSVALICFWQLDKKYSWIFMLIAALIGFSRLYLGVHYPSDVLGGFLVAFVISYIVNKKGSEYYDRNRN